MTSSPSPTSSQAPVPSPSISSQLASVERGIIRSDVPNFRPGDTVRVHAKIVEGNKERIQIFEGMVIKRHSRNGPSASFTVRKVSYNIGVERTFLLHSPRIERVEVVTRGNVRRARLFYLRPLRGKSARIKSRFLTEEESAAQDALVPKAQAQEAAPAEAPAAEEQAS